MKTYKYTSPDNTVAHVIDEDGVSRSSMLAAAIPADAVVEPADIPPPPTVQDELNALDAENMLTQRNLREFILLTTEAIKAATSGAVDLGQLPGVANVANVEARAAVLRAKL